MAARAAWPSSASRTTCSPRFRAGLRRRAARADRPAAGRGLPLGRPARPAATLAHGPQPPGPATTRFRLVTGRRPVVEAVAAAAAEASPASTVRRGVRVAGLLRRSVRVPGVPHVDGRPHRRRRGAARRSRRRRDGPRTPSADWLADARRRARRTVEAADRRLRLLHAFLHRRRSRPGRGPALAPLGSISLLTLFGDNDTWSRHGLHPHRRPAAQGPAPQRRVRRVVRACPLQAHWLDGTPLTGVLPMAGVLDRTAASSSTGGRSPPASPPSATPGPARTRRQAAASASACCTRRRCGRSCAPPRRSRDVRAGVARTHRPRGRAVLLEPGAGGPTTGRGDGRAARGPRATRP